MEALYFARLWRRRTVVVPTIRRRPLVLSFPMIPAFVDIEKAAEEKEEKIAVAILNIIAYGMEKAEKESKEGKVAAVANMIAAKEEYMAQPVLDDVDVMEALYFGRLRRRRTVVVPTVQMRPPIPNFPMIHVFIDIEKEAKEKEEKIAVAILNINAYGMEKAKKEKKEKKATAVANMIAAKKDYIAQPINNFT